MLFFNEVERDGQSHGIGLVLVMSYVNFERGSRWTDSILANDIQDTPATEKKSTASTFEKDIRFVANLTTATNV